MKGGGRISFRRNRINKNKNIDPKTLKTRRNIAMVILFGIIVLGIVKLFTLIYPSKK